MSLYTNLEGRLRNTSLPKSHGLMPVFEAIVNSIHSIEEKGNLSSDGKIILTINRLNQEQLELGKKPTEKITGFSIEDNGCGFNDGNFKSFETLDSDHKIAKGCRGVGRLMWLKAFDHVDVVSHFKQNQNTFKKRTFAFNNKLGVSGNDISPSDEIKSGTTISLVGFHKAYSGAVPKKAEAIANQLLEHCLWYFVREDGIPDIILVDGDQIIRLTDLYDNCMHAQVYGEKIKIYEQEFELTHIKFRASVNKKHQLALCAANRLVIEENIQGKIPGLYGHIKDDTGEFVYTCYVASKYLDMRVRSERTSFNITEDIGGIFGETEISLSVIREAVLNRSKEYLNNVLADNINAGKKRINDFISDHAPRYRPIINYIQDELLIVDPEKTDKELELHLHAQWYQVERELVSEGHEVMRPNNEEQALEYDARLQSYLQKAEDIKKSDLVNYVSHRKVVIDLLQKSIERLEDGKYAREDMIHELIMPMRKESGEVATDSCNLWLIDERLAFHNYLASDKTINSMPITENTSRTEPDLLSLRVFDNPMLVNNQSSLPLGAITVVEIKRPMRNDMKEGEDKDPIDQALGYLERVREGGVKTKAGRPIPAAQSIPGYCYVLCDLTPTMVKRCKSANLTVTADGMGYFGYNDNYKSYIEVISFDQLVKAAKERNRAFFDKLGFPSN